MSYSQPHVTMKSSLLQMQLQAPPPQGKNLVQTGMSMQAQVPSGGADIGQYEQQVLQLYPRTATNRPGS